MSPSFMRRTLRNRRGGSEVTGAAGGASGPGGMTEPSDNIRGMRGIISAGGYLPYRRLDRASITEFLGSGGGRGQRTVASYDEDTTTMGVEAGRAALASAPEGFAPEALWFATV